MLEFAYLDVDKFEAWKAFTAPSSEVIQSYINENEERDFLLLAQVCTPNPTGTSGPQTQPPNGPTGRD